MSLVAFANKILKNDVLENDMPKVLNLSLWTWETNKNTRAIFKWFKFIFCSVIENIKITLFILSSFEIV